MPTTKHEVYPDDDLAQEVVLYADEHGTSLSAAWKELTRRGLQALEVTDMEGEGS